MSPVYNFYVRITSASMLRNNFEINFTIPYQTVKSKKVFLDHFPRMTSKYLDNFWVSVSEDQSMTTCYF